jgi:hypothetical protein
MWGTREVDRRAFVIGMTAAAVGVSGTAAHAATRGTGFTRAAGVAMIGGAPRALCLMGDDWVLADEDSIRPTKGLSGATVVDLAADGRGALAVGSRPAGDGSEAVVWQSADGTAWHEVLRLAGTDSEFTAVAGGLVLGSLLTLERAHAGAVSARRSRGSWRTTPVQGIGHVVTALTSAAGGWTAAAIGTAGTTVYQSADGSAWTVSAKLSDAVVKDMQPGRWVGNGLAGTTAKASAPVGVPRDAVAVGVVGDRSYWLVDGRLIAARI